ncbi:MAG: L,D-transpeptidase [Bacteroidetes bacterium]|nr:MAG: L,D-transpeptidase [Bacteroidota bacterium]
MRLVRLSNNMIIRVTLIALALYATGCSTNAGTNSKTEASRIAQTDSSYTNYHRKAQRVIDSLKLDKEKIYIEVSKSSYLLQLKIGEVVIKGYPVVLGFDPINDKRQEGDGCTPEGTFKIQSKYPHKSWSKFIWFDYPNDESRKKFEARKKKGEIPKDARIGGEVGIHGVPDKDDRIIDQKINWTLGCVSLKTADINEIYSLVKVGTKVVIEH